MRIVDLLYVIDLDNDTFIIFGKMTTSVIQNSCWMLIIMLIIIIMLYRKIVFYL